MNEAPKFHQIGQPLLRKEDYRLLTGQGRYLDDIAVPGLLHACFVRSPYAHARIRSIDAARARAMPGIVAVVSAAELMQWTTTLRMAPPIEGLLPTEITTLPVDKVRFQGDPVVCIVATDRYLAEDAAETVEIDYEVLPAVLSFSDAVRAGAPSVDDSLDTNLVSHQSFATGEVEARMRNAHAVVEASFSQHRQTHMPIETRGCIAIWDGGREHLTFHIGNQVPHPLRTQLAARLRLSESQVTVISPDVGGGFGQKIALYREELTVAALARHLRRPVRWREDRMENLQASSHAREQTCRVRAGVDAEGRILALDLAIEEDFGAYCFYPANYLARVVAMILTGPYRVDTYAFDVKVALTNKCGAGPMRANSAAIRSRCAGRTRCAGKSCLTPCRRARCSRTSRRRKRWKPPSPRSTTKGSASGRPRRARSGAISASGSATWSSRRLTVRASTRARAFRARVTKRSGCASSPPAP
jgi:carbon-monoxide dehydrogenase large subunit